MGNTDTQTDTQSMVWVVAPTSPKSDYMTGFALYAAGHSDSRCKNHAQLDGWYAALHADAACQTIDVMASDGKDAGEFDVFLSSIEDDYEWIRRGC